MKTIDISRKIHEKMQVYPNNPKPRIIRYKQIPRDSSNSSILEIGTHTGTHVDAHFHIFNNGESVEKIKLEKLIGDSIVLDFSREEKIDEKILREKEGKIKIKKNQIILLKTKNSREIEKHFNEKFVYLAEDGARFLAEKKIKAVGIDGLSIDKFHSGNHPSHNVLMKAKITIIEGLDLRKAKEGKYFFCCLPLKIKNGDAGLARAVLIKW